jgi:pimeloyl-ACP methyl ester carboxylesterase
MLAPARAHRPMKAPRAIRATLGVLLCIGGFILARATPFRQTTVVVDSGGCRLVTDIVDTGVEQTQGSVILLHGLVANKKIMSYLAQAFALQNLRVFVPDLPGHGRTQGPFSFSRSTACTETFMRQLIAGGAIDPARTIVAGHSMGGAIAVLTGARVPVAAVISVSPAPISPARGIPAFMLPFDIPPATPRNTLAIGASWEPGAIRQTAQDLVTADPSGSGKYMLIPHSSHVSVLFDRRVARASQEWAARALHLAPAGEQPSPRPHLGALAGSLGILLLAGPFLRECFGANGRVDSVSPAMAAEAPPASSLFRAILEITLASVFAVVLLHFANPPRVTRVFEGDYFAAFLLLVGASLLALHHRKIPAALRLSPMSALAAAFAGLLLHLLIIGWFDLTLSEAWLTPARWARFPVLLVAMLPYHFAEELLLGPSTARSDKARLVLALGFRFLSWLALLLGILFLHSNEVLLVLLALYFGMFCVLQRAGMTVVRKCTGSPMAAALFGAILLAGFCLVVFPIT